MWAVPSPSSLLLARRDLMLAFMSAQHGHSPGYGSQGLRGKMREVWPNWEFSLLDVCELIATPS